MSVLLPRSNSRRHCCSPLSTKEVADSSVSPLTDPGLALSQWTALEPKAPSLPEGSFSEGSTVNTTPDQSPQTDRLASLLCRTLPAVLGDQLLLSTLQWEQCFNQVRLRCILGLHLLHTDSLLRTQLCYL